LDRFHFFPQNPPQLIMLLHRKFGNSESRRLRLTWIDPPAALSQPLLRKSFRITVPKVGKTGQWFAGKPFGTFAGFEPNNSAGAFCFWCYFERETE
jgi:hypothetical protein